VIPIGENDWAKILIVISSLRAVNDKSTKSTSAILSRVMRMIPNMQLVIVKIVVGEE
jgi:hypothetical protein